MEDIWVWVQNQPWAIVAGIATAVGAVAIAVVRVMSAKKHLEQEQRRASELARFKAQAQEMLRHERYVRRTFKNLSAGFPHLTRDDMRFALREMGAVAARTILGEEVWAFPERLDTKREA